MKEPGTHKLTEALDGQQSAADANPEAKPGPPQGPGPTHGEVAEQTRLGQQSRADGIEDRDERLTRVGRGQQTHG